MATTQKSAWLVGSRGWSVGGQVIQVDDSQQLILGELGGLYLLHKAPQLSLITQVRNALLAAGVASPEVVILKNRKVRIRGDVEFSVTWGAGALVRDLLGFDEDLAGASEYVAPSVSPLLWSPGRPENPKLAPLGVSGAPYLDVAIAHAPGGLQTVREHGEPIRRNRFDFRHVPRGRYWTGEHPAAGELVRWYLNVLARSERFVLFRQVGEGPEAEPAEYQVSQVLGPFRGDLGDRKLRRLVVARAQGFKRVEAFYDFSLPVIVAQEFGG